MLSCYNTGCGKEFDPTDNKDDSCRHHPGSPFFHDAYKGWSCCKKKSVDFTEFLNIQGCTVSKHSNVKPPEPEKPAKEETKEEEDKIKVETRKAISSSLVRPPFSAPLTLIKPSVLPALKDAIDALKLSSTKNTQNKPSNGEVPIGTACKNCGCKTTYTSPDDDSTKCQHHPGAPIFHEGMKYWTCCNKKTSDFTAFMNQVGCQFGKHKWFKEENENLVQCRYDYHQTATHMTVAIYAKLYHYELSTIKVNPIRLVVNLVFSEQNNSKFELDMELRGIIKVEATTVKMYGTKVEIVMEKAEPGAWLQLNFPPKKPDETPIEATVKSDENSSDSDDDLDDIEALNPALKLAEF